MTDEQWNTRLFTIFAAVALFAVVVLAYSGVIPAPVWPDTPPR